MTETRAPTDYVKLLERITSTWCWGQPENEADCVALRQLAELLPELLKDARRMDWMERKAEADYFGVGEHESWTVRFSTPRDIATFRAAIDAAATPEPPHD